MSYIIDRRQNPKGKNVGNRQRFIRRANEQIREAVKEAIQKRNIKDVNGGEKVKIPVRDLDEPFFGKSHNSGERDYVHPGNKEYVEGDKVNKPSGGGQGRGRKASDGGEGEDEFSFTLTREEFLEFFFEDLELPDLVKKSLKEIQKTKPKRAGYSNTGNPTALDVEETMRKSMARRMALKRPKDDEISSLEEELAQLTKKKGKTDDELSRKKFLEQEIIRLNSRQKAIPWIDPVDVKYRNFTPQPQPSTKAVMFCIMDVSGSMGEREKDIAKRFFMLLYLFLERRYEKIELVFIRHTTEAKEVDEHTFFHDRESGGTKVSSGLELMAQIIEKRYSPADWNIYAAQASDGENWDGDSELCKKILEEKLLPVTQYFAYIEILTEYAETWSSDRAETELWQNYRWVANKAPSFQPRRVYRASQIWDVFRELFAKRGEK